MDQRISVASMIATTPTDNPDLNVWMSCSHLSIADLIRIADGGLGLDVTDFHKMRPVDIVIDMLDAFKPYQIQLGFESVGYNFNHPLNVQPGLLDVAKTRILTNDVQLDDVPLTFIWKAVMLSTFRKLIGAFNNAK